MYTIVDSSNFSLENYPYDIPTAILEGNDSSGYFRNPTFRNIVKGYQESSPSTILKMLQGTDQSYNYHFIVLDDNNQPIRYIWKYGD